MIVDPAAVTAQTQRMRAGSTLLTPARATTETHTNRGGVVSSPAIRTSQTHGRPAGDLSTR